MTDWGLVTEYVHNSMQAVDQANSAIEKLRLQATLENFDTFRVRMQQLTEELTRLRTVLDDEGAFVKDELKDWLSLTFSGHRAEFRATPCTLSETGC